jgi:hypothetical protein
MSHEEHIVADDNVSTQTLPAALLGRTLLTGLQAINSLLDDGDSALGQVRNVPIHG